VYVPKSFFKVVLEILPYRVFMWSSVHALYSASAGSARRRNAILKQSVSSHLPINAALSMLAKNSSIGLAFSALDHFGTREIRDNSLCMACISFDICSLNKSSSVLDTDNFCFNFFSRNY